jgi:hypothetical protein
MINLTLFGALALTLGADSAGRTAPAAAPGGQTLNCELVALMPNAPLSPDECKVLIDLFQMVAIVNPDAGHDGDERMNCADIRAELSHTQRLGGSQSGRSEQPLVTLAHDLSEAIRANPRLGRLIQLAAARHCKAPRRKTGPTHT